MKKNQIIISLLATTLVAGLTLSLVGVAGGASAGEIRVAPGEVSIQEGEQQTIEINYDSLSSPNPEGMEFAIEYDPDVITVTEVSEGAYFSGGFGSPTTSPGEVRFGIAKDDPVSQDSGTVATITIELADGVDEGDTTDIIFTSVTTFTSETAVDERTPETIDGTVEAAEETPQNPVDYDVQIVDPTISKSSVEGSPSDHTLQFDVINVSSDNNRDNFTVKLPDNVVVEDITETTVVKRGTTEPVALEGSDPATDPNPGNEVNFAVNPIGSSETQALTVEVDMRLSAAP
jgi:hypothetical protein